MRTPSGALSIGSPNSRARFQSEIENAIKGDDFHFELLYLTDEGMDILKSALASLGCDYELCLRKENLGVTSDYMNSKSIEINCFLRGMLKAFSLL